MTDSSDANQDAAIRSKRWEGPLNHFVRCSEADPEIVRRIHDTAGHQFCGMSWAVWFG